MSESEPRIPDSEFVEPPLPLPAHVHAENARLSTEYRVVGPRWQGTSYQHRSYAEDERRCMVDPARYRIEQRTVTTSEWVPAEGPETCACHARPGAPCVCPPVTEKRWQAMNALLSEQLEEARKWHLAAVKEKRGRTADLHPCRVCGGVGFQRFNEDNREGCRAPHCWSEYGTPCGTCPAEKLDTPFFTEQQERALDRCEAFDAANPEPETDT